MNKLLGDVNYIMLINELGDYLNMTYGIGDVKTQKLKYDINNLIEELVERENEKPEILRKKMNIRE